MRELLPFFLAGLTLFGCAGSSKGGDDSSADSANMNNGASELSLDGYPNGLWWDDASQTLFVADDRNNRVLTWTDADGFVVLGDLPAAAASSPGLGQLVLVGDQVIVPRFGDGTAGDVVWIDLDGNTGTIADLDPERRRIGLAVTPAGDLYDSWFVKSGDGDSQTGEVTGLSLDGGETEFVTGSEKPVGLLADDEYMYLADQKDGSVMRKGMPGSGNGGGGGGGNGAGGEFEAFADVPEPDLMCWGRNGGLFVFDKSGIVYEVDATGAASAFYEAEAESSGSQSSRRGVAYDAAGGRLFLSHHDETGAADSILVVTVD